MLACGVYACCNCGDMCVCVAVQSHRSAAAYRIDFTARPEGLSAALAPGSRRQTCLLTAPSSSTADTLLPEDLHYQVCLISEGW